jgi:hypothetical protein
MVFKFKYTAIKNVLIEQKNMKLWIKRHFVDNKHRDHAAELKMQQISFLSKHIKWILEVCLHVCSHTKCRCFKGSIPCQSKKTSTCNYQTQIDSAVKKDRECTKCATSNQRLTDWLNERANERMNEWMEWINKCMKFGCLYYCNTRRPMLNV